MPPGTGARRPTTTIAAVAAGMTSPASTWRTAFLPRDELTALR
jgi:hypothetical protein